MTDPVKDAITLAATLVERVGTVLEGKREVVELAVVGLLAEGHVLVEDVPGVGKTTLARALAASLGLTFRRVQFTSDLLPVDVVGGNVFDRDRNDFVFRPGPVFTQLLLADEINRTTPKTQSALLEAMGERQVSIDGQTHALEAPFFVIATQNPLDFYGTYPLPESQLDRFLLRLRIGHPPSTWSVGFWPNARAPTRSRAWRRWSPPRRSSPRSGRRGRCTWTCPCTTTSTPSCSRRGAPASWPWALRRAPRSPSRAPCARARWSWAATMPFPTT